MSKHEAFLNINLEPPPRNRRIYAAAKMPFVAAAAMTWWVAFNWLIALPFGLVASTVVSFLVNQEAVKTDGLLVVAQNTLYVGLMWTFYLGCVILAVRIFQALFR